MKFQSSWWIVFITIFYIIITIYTTNTNAFRPGYRRGPVNRGSGNRNKPNSGGGGSAVSVNKISSSRSKGTSGKSSTNLDPGFVSRIFAGSPSQKGYSYVSYRSKSVINSRPPDEQKYSSLYKPKQPPPYETYAQQSFAQKPFPPPYDPSIVRNPNQVQTYAKLPPLGRRPTFTQFSTIPRISPSSGKNSWVQNAIFFGLGRYLSLTGLPNYRLYGSRKQSNVSSSSNETTNSNFPVKLGTGKTLYQYEEVSKEEVEQILRTPINTRPLYLNDSIENVPFYGWNYTNWKLVSISTFIPPSKIVSGFKGVLADILLGFSNYFYIKVPLIINITPN